MDGTRRFDIMSMDDQAVERLMIELRTGLTVSEARDLHKRILGRSPTLAELILFGIEGSEHCSYKSSRPYLKLFETEGPDVIIGAKEDAGIVRVARDQAGNGYAIVMSHESHNHPSQIVPYEGAATGIGGNIRDVCCMGARVVALADDLRFGHAGDAHNRWLLDQVVAGIAGYGNPTGIPVIAGGLQFDPGYAGNCLVTVVTLGAIREAHILHSHAPEDADGYDLILVGKPTDNSGFGGASFASFNLAAEKAESDKGAVQEPNAFLGRHLIHATDELMAILRERNLIHRVACKDLGAGGIACASVELADSGGYGAFVDIDNVHVADPTIPAHVILCAETQERYLWAAPKEITPLILSHFNETFALGEVSYQARATVIGRITKETDYVVVSQGETLVQAKASDVTRGFLYHRPLGTVPKVPSSPAPFEPEDLGDIWLSILGHENVACRAPIFERYDKQVQALVEREAGDADVGIIRPFDDVDYPEEIRRLGVTLTCDQNPRINRIDPYRGAMMAVLESYANTVASGAVPVAISDCLCYGNPEIPDNMRQFEQGCAGVAFAAKALKVPVIAGNVSLYNESERGTIPPSPMIAMLGKLENATMAIPMPFQAADSVLLLVGERTEACGGSIYHDLLGVSGGTLPEIDIPRMMASADLIRHLAGEQMIRSCHDISEGGLAVATIEMAIPSGIGFILDQNETLRDDWYLFSEAPGFVLEVSESHESAVRSLLNQAALPCTTIGKTTAEAVITYGKLTIPLQTAVERWRNGLRHTIG